jgi:hypothetical protein
MKILHMWYVFDLGVLEMQPNSAYIDIITVGLVVNYSTMDRFLICLQDIYISIWAVTSPNISLTCLI